MSSHLEYNVGTIPFQDQKWIVGVAYICIHSDIDREIFITECFTKNTVSVKTADGSVYKNCPIDPSKFNDIIWPEDASSIGTPVVFVTEQVHQQPMIIAALKFVDEITDQQEHQFKLSRKFNNNVVDITGSAEEGFLTIVVNGDKNSDFTVKIANPNNDANVLIDVEGQCTITTTETINILSQKEIIQQVGIEDEKSQQKQTNTEFNYQTEKFSINEGEHPMVLGNELKSLMSDLFDAISKITVTTPAGPTPINNLATFQNLKTRLDGILSQIAYLD